MLLACLTALPVSGQTFGNVVMGGGGYVTGVIACVAQTNLFYAKTDVGGAYRWDEPSQSWIALLDWNSSSQTTYQGVESLAVDPQNPAILYLLAGTSYWNGGNTAILRSTNYGTNFTLTDVTAKFKANGNGGDRQKGETLAVDPHKGSILFCGTRANGLFTSTDSGVTWNAVTSLNSQLNIATDSISFVLLDPSTGLAGGATPRIFVGVFRTGTNLFVSNDAGLTWTALTNSPATALPERCAWAGDNNLYISYGVGTNGALMRYTTTNGAWFNCSPAGTQTYGGISVSATNPKFLVASTYSYWLYQPWGAYGDRIYVSANAGTNWVDLFGSGKATMDPNGFPYIARAAIHWAGGLCLDPYNTNRVFTGSGNGIFCTTNLNAGLTTSTWKFQVKGLEEIVPLDFLSVPGGPLLSSVGDQGGFIHTNIAVSPIIGNLSQSSGFAYAALKTNFIARVVVNGELYYSAKTPVTWTKLPSTPGVMTNGSVAIACDGSTILWKSVVGGVQTTYLTTNLGTNWTLGTGLTFACQPQADPLNPAKFYAYNNSDGYLYTSVNNGLAFARAGLAGTGGSAKFRTAPGLEGHVWVALYGNGLNYSTNSGATFVSANVTEADAIALGKIAPGAGYPTLFIWGRPTSSSTVGLYRSLDQAATWVRVNDANHQYGGLGNAGMIEGDKNICGRVYQSSAGRGIPYVDSWTFVTNATLTPLAASLGVTATQSLTVAVSPTNASTPAVIWTSSNPNLATVNTNGMVSALAAGTVNITATTVDGGYAASSTITVTNVLPAPWLGADVGSVATPGYAIYRPGTAKFTVAGSGAGLTNSADAFYLVYQPQMGNVTLSARVQSLAGGDSLAMSGVMLRQSVAAGAPFVASGVTAGSGAVFQSRLTPGGVCTSVTSPAIAPSYWVRLVKLGDTITGYLSPDGSVWTKQASVTCPLGANFSAGLPVTSHNNGVLTSAILANVTVATPAAALLTYASAGGPAFVLSWPVDHIGWLLQSNSTRLQNPAAWFNLPGSDLTNQLGFTVNPAVSNVFYRLLQP